MRRASLLLAILVGVTSVAVAQEDSSCPDPTFQARLLTPPALRIPRDAQLVVGLFAGGSLTELPPLSLTRRNREVSFVREQLAPGLFRLRPDATRIYGRYTFSGIPGVPAMLFGRPGIGAAPPQPRVDRVERYRVVTGGASRTEVRAHLPFPMPAGIVAVIVYWGEDAEPDLFARAIPTRSEVVIYRSSSDCSQLPAGGSAPPTEGTVRIAFVDQYGQVSPRSEPVSLGN